jgi:Zn-dependent M16 (insulinase) family peptidase
MSSWLYDDKKPFLHLKDTAGYSFLKDKIGTGYYEKVIREYMLENTFSSIVILKPKTGLNAEKEEQLKVKLASYKKGLSREEIAENYSSDESTEGISGAALYERGAGEDSFADQGGY